jgi:N-acetyl-anhydromuramyl-L-alanine amidase AmpD
LLLRSSMIRKAAAVFTSGCVVLACACTDRSPAGPGRDCPQAALVPVLPDSAALLPASPFDEVFAAAGSEFGVSPDLLKTLAWVETRWQMVNGHEEFPGLPAAHGVMALRGDRLERGAALAGVPAETARRDARANIRSAAALLAEDARLLGVDRSRLADWEPVVARFSGIELPAGRHNYSARVSSVLSQGIIAPALRSGPSAQTPIGAAVARAPDECPDTVSRPPDHAGAIWRPSPNFNARPAGSTGTVHMIVIHTCEGSYAGCWSWLANSVSGVSSHYVVDEDGAEITQLVRETDRAWHIAASYDCTLNNSHDCGLNGVQSNHFTIGIEHAGFAAQTSFPASQIDASARLACELTKRRGIPRDRLHFVGHGQLQPANRTDPGANWPWTEYLTAIRRHCGDINATAAATR